jgi:hypothetical protein
MIKSQPWTTTIAAKSLEQTRNSVSDSYAPVTRGNQISILYRCPSLFKRGGKGEESNWYPREPISSPWISSCKFNDVREVELNKSKELLATGSDSRNGTEHKDISVLSTGRDEGH